MGSWVLGAYSVRACGLVGISCGNYSGIVICAAELIILLFLGRIDFQIKKIAVSLRAVDFDVTMF